jgi:hypothetical protein
MDAEDVVNQLVNWGICQLPSLGILIRNFAGFLISLGRVKLESTW